MSSVLIFGGSGKLAKFITERLVKKQYNVVYQDLAYIRTLRTFPYLITLNHDYTIITQDNFKTNRLLIN